MANITAFNALPELAEAKLWLSCPPPGLAINSSSLSLTHLVSGRVFVNRYWDQDVCAPGRVRNEGTGIATPCMLSNHTSWVCRVSWFLSGRLRTLRVVEQIRIGASKMTLT